MESNLWFVPEILGDNLNILQIPPDQPINGSLEIKKASALTIYLHGVFIATSRDKRGTPFNKKPGDNNDLFVASSHKTGDTPKVQRIHYYKKDEPINRMYSNFFDSVIYSTKDYKYDMITLNIQVYDVDEFDQYKDALTAISGMGSSLAVNFPILSQYTALAMPGISGILNLVDTLDTHYKIIDENFRLEIAHPNIGSIILQTGNFIYFNKPQKEGLKFDSTKRVVKDNGDPFTDCDYAIISIRNTEIQEINEWEKDQMAANLMTELHGKGSSGKAAVEFVKNTIDGYNNFKNLQRYSELANKQNPTPEETAPISKLKQDPDLVPYLPK